MMRRRFSSNRSNKSILNWKTPYLDIIAVATIQFLLSLLILCYGVFLMQFVLKDLYDLKTTVWTAISFVAASKITSPWVKSYCKHLDSAKNKIHKRNIIIAVFLLFIDLLTVSFINTSTNQIIFYGTFGGILSTVIYVHLRFATAEAFRFQIRTFDVLDQVTKPFGLIFMPHLMLYVTNLYGTAQAELILSGLMLNIIPACLLIRRKRKRKVRLCKFQTVDRLSIEMSDLNSKSTKEPSSSSEDEDSDECEEATEEIEVEVKSEPSSPEPSSNNVQKYFENFGVNILPNIPEENEIEEEDDINEISSKRLSRISAILQELNENIQKHDNLSATNLFQPDEIVEPVESEHENEKFMDDFITTKSRCFSITSNVVYAWRLKKRKVKSFICNNFIRSVPRTLSTVHFYPAVISNCITTTVSTIIFTTAPCLMFLKNEHVTVINYPNTPEEATFLLTIIGFTWLFFLAGYPVFSTLSSFKIKILFLVGLSISGLSLFIAHKFSYDNFTLFSLTFGLGHGIISYTENNAHENFFGLQRWETTQGALEISTGYIVILVYLIIYYNSLDIYILLSYAYWLYAFDVALWIVAYIVKLVVIRFKQ